MRRGKQMLTFRKVFISEVPAGASISARETGRLSFGPVDAYALATYVRGRRSRLASNWRLTAKPIYSLNYYSAKAYQLP